MRRAIVMGLVLAGCGSDPPVTSDPPDPSDAGSDGGNTMTDGGTENDGSVVDAGDDGGSGSVCYAYDWSFKAPQNVNWARGYASTDMGAAVSSGGIAFTPMGGAPRIGMSVQGQVTLDGMDQTQAASPIAVVLGLKP